MGDCGDVSTAGAVVVWGDLGSGTPKIKHLSKDAEPVPILLR